MQWITGWEGSAAEDETGVDTDRWSTIIVKLFCNYSVASRIVIKSAPVIYGIPTSEESKRCGSLSISVRRHHLSMKREERNFTFCQYSSSIRARSGRVLLIITSRGKFICISSNVKIVVIIVTVNRWMRTINIDRRRCLDYNAFYFSYNRRNIFAPWNSCWKKSISNEKKIVDWKSVTKLRYFFR